MGRPGRPDLGRESRLAIDLATLKTGEDCIDLLDTGSDQSRPGRRVGIRVLVT